MARAAAYAGKELIINSKTYFIGLFRWPVTDDPESYFAALMVNVGGDNWSTLVQLPPMTALGQTKGAQATMADILTQFNAKIAETNPPSNGSIPSETDTWIQRMKKLFDNVKVENGKIVTVPL